MTEVSQQVSFSIYYHSVVEYLIKLSILCSMLKHPSTLLGCRSPFCAYLLVRTIGLCNDQCHEEAMLMKRTQVECSNSFLFYGGDCCSQLSWMRLGSRSRSVLREEFSLHYSQELWILEATDVLMDVALFVGSSPNLSTNFPRELRRLWLDYESIA